MRKYLQHEKVMELLELRDTILFQENYEIGNRFLKAREKLGITQDELAKAILVSETTIRNWENGIGTSKMLTYALLENVFDTTLEELLTGSKTDSELTEKSK